MRPSNFKSATPHTEHGVQPSVSHGATGTNGAAINTQLSGKSISVSRDLCPLVVRWVWLDGTELTPKFTHHGELQNRGLIGYTRFNATAETTIPDMAAWSNCKLQIMSCTGRGGGPYWSFRVVTRYPGPRPAIYRLCCRSAGPPSALKHKSAVEGSNDRLYGFGHTRSLPMPSSRSKTQKRLEFISTSEVALIIHANSHSR